MRTFTAAEIVSKFKEHTGFAFQTTVPGQLLARSRIKPVGISFGKKTYSADHWFRLWDLMLQLADERCKYQNNLTPPTKRGVPLGPLAGSQARKVAGGSIKSTRVAGAVAKMDREASRHIKDIAHYPPVSR